MWLEFIFTSLFFCILLYVPGILILTSFYDHITSIALAPLLSGVMYMIFGLFTYGIKCDPSIVACCIVCSCIFISFCIFYCSNRGNLWDKLKDSFASIFTKKNYRLVFFLFLPVIVSLVVFVKNLDGAYSFSQLSDNCAHLASIKSMVNSGNYSILHNTGYMNEIISGTSPFLSNKFYPNIWRIEVGLVSSILSVPVTLALNSSLFVYLAIIFPLSCFYFFESLHVSEIMKLAGSLFCLSFAAFPYGLLIFGPLYPNFAAFCFVPAGAGIVYSALDTFFLEDKETVYKNVLLAVISVCCIAVTHPNAVFTLGVLIVPLLVIFAYKVGWKLTDRKWGAILSSIACVVLISIIWVALYKFPPFEHTVTFNWAPTHDYMSGLRSIADLSLRYGHSQIVLSVFVLLGITYTLLRKKNTWLSFSYLLLVAIYYFDSTCQGALQHFFSGFWYNDQWRTAASITFAALPLACYGFEYLIESIAKLFNVYKERQLRATIAVVCLMSFVFVFWITPFENQKSSFAFISKDLKLINVLDDYQSYTKEEAEFIEKVKTIVEADDLIINTPIDGSLFAYYSNDLNFFYRTLDGSLETEESKIIRKNLRDYSSNSQVQDVVQELDARYVLILNRNSYHTNGSSHWSVFNQYSDESWEGIPETLDSVQGFEPVLQESGCSLYRIIPVGDF